MIILRSNHVRIIIRVCDIFDGEKKVKIGSWILRQCTNVSSQAEKKGMKFVFRLPTQRVMTLNQTMTVGCRMVRQGRPNT